MYKEMYYKGKLMFILRIINCTNYVQHCPLSDGGLDFIEACTTFRVLAHLPSSGVGCQCDAIFVITFLFSMLVTTS
jgi:hypothetical protein